MKLTKGEIPVNRLHEVSESGIVYTRGNKTSTDCKACKRWEKNQFHMQGYLPLYTAEYQDRDN